MSGGRQVRERIDAGFERWGRWVFRHPWAAIVALLLLAAGPVSQLPRITIDTSATVVPGGDLTGQREAGATVGGDHLHPELLGSTATNLMHELLADHLAEPPVIRTVDTTARLRTGPFSEIRYCLC